MSETSIVNYPNCFAHLPGGGKRLSASQEDPASKQWQRYVTPLHQVYASFCAGRGTSLLDEFTNGHSARRLAESAQAFHGRIDRILGQELGVDDAVVTRLNCVVQQLNRQPAGRRTPLQNTQFRAGFAWLKDITDEVWAALEAQGFTTKDFAA